MAKRKFTVVGAQGAYGVARGETVTLDDSDELVRLNITAGVIGPAEDQPEAEKTPCPACVDEGKQRPPKFESHAELADHYREKHPALAVPNEGEVS